VAKFQVPIIGGIRKVIRPSAGAPPPGTTIAELGAQTISLAQLALILTNIQSNQNNTGGGNIGPHGLPGARGLPGMYWQAEDGADGEQGPPGLPGKAGVAGAAGAAGAGGAPGMDGEPGADGDIGPPGVAGQQGIQGVPGVPGAGLPGAGGPALYFTAEDGQDGDPGAPGQPGTPGAAGSAGAAGAPGGVGPMSTVMMVPQDDNQDDGMMHYVPDVVGPLTVNGIFVAQGSAATPFTVGGAAANYSGGMNAVFQNGSTVNGDTVRYSLIAGSQNFSIFKANQNQATAIITGGPIGPQTCLRNLDNTPLVFGINNTLVGSMTTAKGITMEGIVSAKGVTPAPVSGRTDIGVTTTTSGVISTATGVNMSALTTAAVMWVVNVSGVQYGVPCFAL
jgi:hypothetical protein